jgi:hypothetical protein
VRRLARRLEGNTRKSAARGSVMAVLRFEMRLIYGIYFCDISIADVRLALRKRKQMPNIEGALLTFRHCLN